jgi:N-acetylmuramic acid 6-phosphate (MurNAc-6-P) etherase
MINMQLTNQKLRERGQRILISATGASPTRAAQTLKAARGNLPVALLMLHKRMKRDEALQLLTRGKNIAAVLRATVGERL